MKTKFIKTFIPLILLGVVLQVFSACSHYHMGSPQANLPFSKLYIKPVANKAYIPQAQALLSNQLAQALQQAGVQITHRPDEADATLVVTLVDYVRTTATTQKADTFLANAFTLELTADCCLIDEFSGKPFFTNHRVTVHLNTFFEKDAQAIEYQDMPILTNKLAQNIKNLVVNVW